PPASFLPFSVLSAAEKTARLTSRRPAPRRLTLRKRTPPLQVEERTLRVAEPARAIRQGAQARPGARTQAVAREEEQGERSARGAARALPARARPAWRAGLRRARPAMKDRARSSPATLFRLGSPEGHA